MNAQKLLSLWGLKWNPFSPELPVEALLVTPKIENFAWRVEQLVQEGGFALISGESGTGKSVALRIAAGRLAALRDVSVPHETLAYGHDQASWPIVLPDLTSRLRALPVVTLEPPDDALLAAVLVKLFADRQLEVDDRLVDFLVHRIERSVAAARAAVDELDSEALRLLRPVNRALAVEVLHP